VRFELSYFVFCDSCSDGDMGGGGRRGPHDQWEDDGGQGGRGRGRGPRLGAACMGLGQGGQVRFDMCYFVW
jgi:hypothetical protein